MVTSIHVERQRGDHLVAAACARSHTQLSVEETDALAHPQMPVPRAPRLAFRGGRAAPVVGHPQFEAGVLVADQHGGPGMARVFEHVGERLLDDAERREIEAGGQGTRDCPRR